MTQPAGLGQAAAGDTAGWAAAGAGAAERSALCLRPPSTRVLSVCEVPAPPAALHVSPCGQGSPVPPAGCPRGARPCPLAAGSSRGSGGAAQRAGARQRTREAPAASVGSGAAPWGVRSERRQRPNACPSFLLLKRRSQNLL